MLDSRHRGTEKLNDWNEQKGRSGRRRADGTACKEENQEHRALQVITLFSQPVLQSAVVLFHPKAFAYPIKGTNFTSFSLLLISISR